MVAATLNLSGECRMPRSCRLGATSFVYPDAALPNVERLAPRVDDIELLFFDVSDPAGLPDGSELQRMAALKAEHGLSFSLHTPLDASLASADEGRREAGVATVLKSIALARPLEPENFVLHVYQGDREGEGLPDSPDAWRERAKRSLAALLESGVPSRRLCIEWLDYDLAPLTPLIEDLDLSVALDIGHLHRDGVEIEPVMERFLDRTRVIHWHGTDGEGRDHRSLEHFPEAEGRRIVRRLETAQWNGVLTLEVFNEADFERSLNRLESLSAGVSTCAV